MIIVNFFQGTLISNSAKLLSFSQHHWVIKKKMLRINKCNCFTFILRPSFLRTAEGTQVYGLGSRSHQSSENLPERTRL